MATKTASGRTISAKAARGRGKLVAALQRQGLDPLKVREAAGYPNILEWALYPQGAKRDRTGIVATLNGREWLDSSKASEVFSMGEGKSSTRRDVRVGDVIKVAHPATDGGFPWRFRFRFEGEQFSEVSGGKEIAAASALPQCTFSVVDVDSIDDTINLVDYDTAMSWLQGITSVTATASGSASAEGGEFSASVSGTVEAVAATDQATGVRPCSIVTDTTAEQLFDEAEGTEESPPYSVFELEALLKAEAKILATSQEYRVSGVVIGYSLPIFAQCQAGASYYMPDGAFFFLSQKTYTVRSGAKGIGVTSTELVTVGGLTLTAEIKAIEDDTEDEDINLTSSLAAGVAAEVVPIATTATTLDNGQAVIPPPDGWPIV